MQIDLDPKSQNYLYMVMADRQLTQSTVAKRLGVSQAAVSSYLQGKSAPRPLTMLKLARALGLEPGELLRHFAECCSATGYRTS